MKIHLQARRVGAPNDGCPIEINKPNDEHAKKLNNAWSSKLSSSYKKTKKKYISLPERRAAR